MPGSESSRTLRFQITTTDAKLIEDLLEGARQEEGQSVEIAEGGSLTLTRHSKSRSWGQPEVIEFALKLTTNVAAPIVAAWIMQKLKDRKTKVKLNEQTLTTITQQGLELLIKQLTGSK